MCSFKIQKLDWDSNFFGYEIGKLVINNISNNEEILSDIKKSPFKLVQVFSKIKFNDIHNYSPIDTKLTYSKKISARPNNFSYIHSTSNDFEGSLIKLAKSAGLYSRYNLDKHLNSKFEKMYEIWMKKSLNRELANEVLAYIYKNKFCGIVTIKERLKNAEIGLIAVDNNFQRNGIGSQLLQYVENWAFKRNLENIFVSTQERNLKACKLYEKNKYSVKDKTFIYHIWNII